VAQLELWRGNERSLYGLTDERFRIGRNEDCHLRLDEPLVSRHHAAVFREGARYYVEDLGSTNGTTVDDEPVRPWTPVAVDHGSRIGIGGAATLTLLLSMGERPSESGVTIPGQQAVNVRLTPAENEVLHLLFLNYREGQAIPQVATVEQIAAARNSSTAAVKQVLQGLYNKLHLNGSERNKDTLARKAVELGLAYPR